ncbi:type-2 ice-structuring protein-like isoform X1 [Archocentrus centrarchus]|uniref:type-2 ice-structuring protein-like isoform X1 n=1 Tax=Archocentrus centrarchus TaxID=63155 RepID=UPI0011E9FF9D|nr:type-2 ice-structuring protein-like isoform X1 [Archocentrus centrarchus]
MNMLTVCALVCTIVALAGSADLPETKAKSNETGKTHLVKMSSKCDDGWTQLNGRCFYYVAELMTWDKAEANCVSLGGHLASVHNAMEYCRLQRLILSATHEEKETWIGGCDAQEESHWIWSDGTIFHFNNWCPGEPNNQGSYQHCLQMNYGVEKCFDDFECHGQRPSVCAKNM